MKHNRFDLQDLSLDELAEIFELRDSLGHHEQAAAILAEMLSRSARPAQTVHEVPQGLAKLLPRRLWHQKPVGEGRTKA